MVYWKYFILISEIFKLKDIFRSWWRRLLMWNFSEIYFYFCEMQCQKAMDIQCLVNIVSGMLLYITLQHHDFVRPQRISLNLDMYLCDGNGYNRVFLLIHLCHHISYDDYRYTDIINCAKVVGEIGHDAIRIQDKFSEGYTEDQHDNH